MDYTWLIFFTKNNISTIKTFRGERSAEVDNLHIEGVRKGNECLGRMDFIKDEAS